MPSPIGGTARRSRATPDAAARANAAGKGVRAARESAKNSGGGTGRQTFRFSLIHLSVLFAALLVDHYVL